MAEHPCLDVPLNWHKRVLDGGKLMGLAIRRYSDGAGSQVRQDHESSLRQFRGMRNITGVLDKA